MLEIVEDQIAELKKLWKNKRLLLHQGLNLAMIVFSALMIWKGLMFLTKSESPVVVVLSGSMEPAFQRGDILFLNNQANPIRVGEVVVFKIKDRIDPCEMKTSAPAPSDAIAPPGPDSLVDFST